MKAAVAEKLWLALIIALFLVRNLPWHLDDFDQAKQAYVSFEMVTQNHWWFQHTPMQNVATKPPLAGWISASLFFVTHCWEAAWRLPSLASALAILLLLWRAGARLWPAAGGWVAFGFFGLNLMTPRLSTLVRTDMMLTFFIFGAGLLIYEKVRTAAPWEPLDRAAIFICVLGSMLTKGPIAYAFLLPGLATFYFVCQRRRVPANAWSGWWSWFGPLLVFLAWAGMGIARDRDFYEQVVMKEFLGRFTVGEQAVHRNQPVYFYVAHVLRDFAPWSLLLAAWPFHKGLRRSLLADRAALWLVCWSMGGLVFMSLVPSKRPDRIFPIIPPLCLLLAHFFREAHLAGRPAKRLVTISLGVALVISGGYTVFNISQSYRAHEEVLATFGARVRDYSQKRGWRYAATTGKDEGMLLYLRQPAFVKMRDAQWAWSEGTLDAMVVNAIDFQKNLAPLGAWSLIDASGLGAGKSSQYFFIARSEQR